MAEQLPTRSDLFRIGAAEIFQRSAKRPAGTRISPEAVFVEGTDANLIVAQSAAMGDEALRHLGARTGALFYDSAEGEDLDRLVLERTNNEVPRKNASASLVSLIFNRTDLTTGGIEYEVGRRVRTQNGIEFELLTAMTMVASATIGYATAQAVSAGRAGNVSENTIIDFVGPKPQSDLIVTNTNVAAGGSERETDAEYVARARDFFRSVRRGTLGAIEFGALQVTGVTRVNVIEEKDSEDIPTGLVTCYIADAEGRSNDLLLNKVKIALLEYRCLGIPVSLFSGVVQLVQINYTVQFDASADTVAAADQLRTLTVSALEAQRPGGILRHALLNSVARSVPGIIVSDDSIDPSNDLVPTEPNYVIRTTKALVTVNGI